MANQTVTSMVITTALIALAVAIGTVGGAQINKMIDKA